MQSTPLLTTNAAILKIEFHLDLSKTLCLNLNIFRLTV